MFESLPAGRDIKTSLAKILLSYISKSAWPNSVCSLTKVYSNKLGKNFGQPSFEIEIFLVSLQNVCFGIDDNRLA